MWRRKTDEELTVERRRALRGRLNPFGPLFLALLGVLAASVWDSAPAHGKGSLFVVGFALCYAAQLLLGGGWLGGAASALLAGPAGALPVLSAGEAICAACLTVQPPSAEGRCSECGTKLEGLHRWTCQPSNPAPERTPTGGSAGSMCGVRPRQ